MKIICELMSRYEDNYFDLAIVDPPYGIDDKLYRSSNGGCVGGLTNILIKDGIKKRPNDEYFNELKRVSKNQIVWGVITFLYFREKDVVGLITWDKMVHI